MKGDVLVIPPTGLMDLFQSKKDFDPVYYERVLIKKGRGDFAMVDARIDDQEFKIGILINNPVDEPVNPRAREACATFFGWHMVFVGPVFIAGLTNEQATTIIGALT